MRTIVYVDGFNLYYRALKGTPYRWLDLVALFQNVLEPKNQIVKVKYFTARVSASISDPSQPQRQDAYIRALKAYRPEIEFYFGHYLSHVVRMPLANSGAKLKMADVIKREEKGSDVNLAVHLLNDAWLDEYDCAVVVSNDSDLAESMRLVRQRNGKLIGLLTPGVSNPSFQLKTHTDFARHIRPGALANSQLPDPIPGTNIKKPSAW